MTTSLQRINQPERRIFAFLISAMALISTVESTAQTQSPTELYVGKVHVVQGGQPTATTSGTNWSYTNGILSLNGARINIGDTILQIELANNLIAAIYAKGNLTINIQGTNTLSTNYEGSPETGSGIYIEGIVTFRGAGKLEASVEKGNKRYGISATQIIIYETPTITVKATEKDNAIGLKADKIFLNGGTVTAQGSGGAMSTAPTLGYDNNNGARFTASANFEGTPLTDYNSGNPLSHKYLKIEPGDNGTWTLDNSNLTITGNDGLNNWAQLADSVERSKVTNVTFDPSFNPTEIPQNAFKGCSKLGSVTLPESVKTIGGNAFTGCSALASVTFKGKNVDTIGLYAFSSCTALTQITLPASVKAISNGAFSLCKKLATVTFMGVDPPSIKGIIFSTGNGYALKTILVPSGSVDAYKQALGNNLAKLVAPLPTLITSADGLKAALTSPTPQVLQVGENIELSPNDAITLAADQTLTIPAGKTVTIAGSKPVSIGTHTLSINGGGSLVCNTGISVEGGGKLQISDGSKLTGTEGATILLAKGSKVQGANGQISDAGTAITTDKELTVQQATTDIAPADNQLIEGYYKWDGSKFCRSKEPVITGITISNAGSLQRKGTALKYIGEVSGLDAYQNPFDRTILWSLEGNKDDGTTITPEGLLIIPTEETAEQITVTATANGDKSFSSSKTLSIIEPDGEFDAYIIVFDATGGTVSPNTLIAYPATSAPNAPTPGTLPYLPTPTRADYNFKGWYSVKDYEADETGRVTTLTKFNASTTLYAHWTERPVTIATAVTYDPALHKDRLIIVTSGGTLTIDTDNTQVKSLTIEEGGQVMGDNKTLTLTSERVALAYPNRNRWIATSKPTPNSELKSRNSKTVYLISGYTDANEQEWTNYSDKTSSLADSSPVLIAGDGIAGDTLELFSSINSITINKAAPESPDGPLNTGVFLFKSNMMWHNVKMSNIYVLSDDGSRFELRDNVTLKPFESYVVANEATRSMQKSLRLDGVATGTQIAPTDNSLHAWTADGRLYLSADRAEKVFIYHVSGSMKAYFPVLQGQTSVALPSGIYIVRQGDTSIKITL